jgi:hypothetical protein
MTLAGVEPAAARIGCPTTLTVSGSKEIRWHTFLHAEMCENWNYVRLSAHIKKESIDEMKHAEALIERILFLDGLRASPNRCS